MRPMLHHRKRRPHCTRDELSDPANLLWVTPSHHRWIHANPDKAYALGHLVRSWEDPRMVAVQPHPDVRLVTEYEAA